MIHYRGIGLYADLSNSPADVLGYIMDDFGNLVPINMFQFDQNIYIRTGRID